MTTFDISYRYELLDRYEDTLGDLEGVVKNSGQHSESAQNQVHTSAQVTIRDTGQVSQWAHVRIKPWVTVNGVEWPLGVFIPSIPKWDHTGDGRVAQVTMADKTILLQRDYFGLTASGVEKGYNIVAAVDEIITSTGETNVALTPSNDTLNASVEWEPDKNKLTCANTLLDANNYFSLYPDRDGQYQLTPYRSPQSRGISARFVDGEDGIKLPDHGIYLPDFTSEQDLDKAPNVYQTVSATEGDEEALFAEAVNDDPDDPLSTVNRGRVMPEGGPEFDVATSGQSALQEYANRKLVELSLPSMVLTIHTPPRQIRFNDVVRFRSDRHNIDGLFVVSNVNASHAADSSGMWQITLRKVVES